jgi:hypothetical protein
MPWDFGVVGRNALRYSALRTGHAIAGLEIIIGNHYSSPAGVVSDVGHRGGYAAAAGLMGLSRNRQFLEEARKVLVEANYVKDVSELPLPAQ